MPTSASSPQLITKIEISILKTLIYFDIFDYPLTENEIRNSCSTRIDKDKSLTEELKHLISQEKLYKVDGFYLLRPFPELVDRRLKGNGLAVKKLKLALRIGELIGSFPFVTGVMLSGSISKGYMEDQSDIDFFLITKPGRLWLARTLLVLFKRIFLLNSHKYFCVNYFLDSEHLEIEDKNIFTATEIVTLIPAYNPSAYVDFIASNPWIAQYYPNFRRRSPHKHLNGAAGSAKRALQFVLDNRVGDNLEEYFQKLTFRRWVSKYSGLYPEVDFERAFRTRNYVSKSHPRDFQKVVIDRYSRKIKEFEEKHSIELD